MATKNKAKASKKKPVKKSRATATKKTASKKKAATRKKTAKKSTVSKAKKTTKKTKKVAANKPAAKKVTKKTQNKSTKKATSKAKATTKKKATAKKVTKKKTAKSTKAKQSKPSSKKIEVTKSASATLKIEKTAEKKKPLVPTPSMKVLRSFRKAAKETRKLVKEKAKKAKTSKDFLAKPPKKGKKYSVDLRIHSPGTVGYFTAGGVEPGPALVRLAKVKGLDMVGLTDYYNPSYIDSVQSSAKDLGITIIPGMDLRCRVEDCEEVFITALFPEHYTSVELYQILEKLEVPESAKGDKDYCVDKAFSEVLAIIEDMHGVVIPSRLDKTPYRQLAIPHLVEKYGIHAFDLVNPENPEFFKRYWPSGKFTFFSFSNAQALAQIGNRTWKVKLESPGFEGLKARIQRREPQHL